MEPEEFVFRVESRTHRMVKKRVVEGTGNERRDYDSTSEFASAAIESHAKSLKHSVGGGDLLRELIELLLDVESLDGDPPAVDSVARLGKGDLTRHISIEIPREIAGVISDIQDETDMNVSEICRACLFKHLSKIAGQPDNSLLYEDEEVLVLTTWMNIQTNLLSVESRFHEILFLRFVRFPDMTRKIASQDSQRFERFAKRYQEELVGTEQYEGMKETYGEQCFTNVENVIEEVTEIELGPDEGDAFLASELEDTKTGT